MKARLPVALPLFSTNALEILMMEPPLPASCIRKPTYFEHNQAPVRFILNTLSHSLLLNFDAVLVLPDQIHAHKTRVNVLPQTILAYKLEKPTTNLKATLIIIRYTTIKSR